MMCIVLYLFICDVECIISVHYPMHYQGSYHILYYLGGQAILNTIADATDGTAEWWDMHLDLTANRHKRRKPGENCREEGHIEDDEGYERTKDTGAAVCGVAQVGAEASAGAPHLYKQDARSQAQQCLESSSVQVLEHSTGHGPPGRTVMESESNSSTVPRAPLTR